MVTSVQLGSATGVSAPECTSNTHTSVDGTVGDRESIWQMQHTREFCHTEEEPQWQGLSPRQGLAAEERGPGNVCAGWGCACPATSLLLLAYAAIVALEAWHELTYIFYMYLLVSLN